MMRALHRIVLTVNHLLSSSHTRVTLQILPDLTSLITSRHFLELCRVFLPRQALLFDTTAVHPLGLARLFSILCDLVVLKLAVIVFFILAILSIGPEALSNHLCTLHSDNITRFHIS